MEQRLLVRYQSLHKSGIYQILGQEISVIVLNRRCGGRMASSEEQDFSPKGDEFRIRKFTGHTFHKCPNLVTGIEKHFQIHLRKRSMLCNIHQVLLIKEVGILEGLK